jgi:membrane protein
MAPGWLGEELGRWGREGRTILGATRDLIAMTGQNDLLTYASAMAYQLLFALPAVLLAGLAVLGFADLQDVWDSELAPRLQELTSESIFNLVSTSAEEVIESRSGFWLSIGLLLALWYLSGATRAVMGVMNKIYRTEESRPFWGRMLLSLLLTLAVAMCFAVAIVAVYFSPALVARLGDGVAVSILAPVLRWLLVLALLYLALLLFVRYAPARQREFRRGSLTAVLIVGGWILTSFGFRWYVTSLANYQSIFGNLASTIILMAYLYLSAVVLVYGLQIDALVRGVEEEAAAGD